MLPLPFRTGTFDAVVLNGVLEWVPVTAVGAPRQCQLAMLRELRRLLKTNGQLYVGIENRVGLKYFRGAIDEHSHLKFTSLMPRRLANAWSRARRNQDYRTYTYSRRGYAKLLREAGFTQVDFYCPYPDYREFDRLVPVTAAEIKPLYWPSSAWKRMVLRMPGSAQLLKWAVPSFSIVASNSRPGALRLHRIVNEISDRIGVKCDTPVRYYSKPIGEVFAFCTRDGDSTPTILMRIAETQVAIDARLAAARHLESLWDRCHGKGSCMNVVPRSIGRGIVGNAAFTAEEVKRGVSWRRISDFRRAPGGALLAVTDWLVEFQHATKTNCLWNHEVLRAQTRALADSVQRILPERRAVSCISGGTRALDCDEEGLPQIPVVVCHGDLHLDNVLFSPDDKRLTGVVDWDLGTMQGLPLTDLFILLINYAMVVKGETYARAVQSLLEPNTLTGLERAALGSYEAAFALDETYRRYAIRVAVLQDIVTLSDRRPETFRRLSNDFTDLPPTLLRAATVLEVVQPARWVHRGESERKPSGNSAT